MDKTERVAKRVKNLLVQVLQIDIDPEDIADDEPLFGDGLDADSMLSLELISAIEEAFGIEVTDDELRVEMFEYVEGKTLSASC